MAINFFRKNLKTSAAIKNYIYYKQMFSEKNKAGFDINARAKIISS